MDIIDYQNDNGSAVEPEHDGRSPDARLEHLSWIAYGVIAPTIIAIGVTGNVANLVVLTRPSLRSVTHVYLMWLAIVDLLCQLIIIPSLLNLAGADGLVANARYAAIYHAHFELALINGLMAASVFIVVALTVDRYVSVSKPTKFRRIHTYRRAKVNISMACCAAVVLNVPMCVSRRVTARQRPGGIVYYQTNHNRQVVDSVAWKTYLWSKEIVTRIGPAILLAILNAIIIYRFRQLLKRRKRRNAKSCLLSSASSSQSDALPFPSTGGGNSTVLVPPPPSGTKCSFGEERRVVFLLVGIVVIFFVAMTPAALVSILSSDEKFQQYEFQAFRAFANDMELLNYALNFYVYCLCSSEIRQTFIKILCCHKDSQHDHNEDDLPEVVEKKKLSFQQMSQTFTKY